MLKVAHSVLQSGRWSLVLHLLNRPIVGLQAARVVRGFDRVFPCERTAPADLPVGNPLLPTGHLLAWVNASVGSNTLHIAIFPDDGVLTMGSLFAVFLGRWLYRTRRRPSVILLCQTGEGSSNSRPDATTDFLAEQPPTEAPCTDILNAGESH